MRIVRSLRELGNEETLLVQSGKPVGVFRTHAMAPRVLIANSNLVPAWATWEHFRDLEAKGLIMYGQMTAGSWIYIGTQGILQGTFETFAEIARRHFGGTLKNRWVLTAGLGGMGGAQPLSVTMNEGVALVVEVDPERIRRRIETRYLDRQTEKLEEALQWVREATAAGTPLSIGLLGNASEVLPELLRRGERPDIVTDQTSAHDELNGYVPGGMTLAEAIGLRGSDPGRYIEASMRSMARHTEAMVGFLARGSIVFDYGNNLRGQAKKAGYARAFDFPGFVPAYIRPLFCRGKGPFRWVALSGEPDDIRRTDQAILETFPGDSVPRALDPDGGGEGCLPRTSVAHLLARVRGAGADRPRLQRPGRARGSARADRDRARSSRCGIGREPVSRDGRECSTAVTQSPTGRS